MAGAMKPNKRHEHVYAIIRHETDADENSPIHLRVTVKKIVSDPQYAETEVKRLNELNKDKGSYYFYQVTRFEDAPVEARAISPMQWAGSEKPRA